MARAIAAEHEGGGEEVHIHPRNQAALDEAASGTPMIQPSAELRDGEEPSLPTPLSGTSVPGAIDNGTVRLGVDRYGQLNVFDPTVPRSISGTAPVGLRYMPTNADATAAGCVCEGWGVGDPLTGIWGGANNASGGAINLTLISYERTATEAISVVQVGTAFKVTHHYRPSPNTPYLYEVTVTVENISASSRQVRYRRVMDWDIEPTPFSERVTLQRGTATAIFRTDNNGFNSQNPFDFVSFGLLNVNFVDAGPNDHGALFDFDFGVLTPGQTREFRTFYGAAGTEAHALGALAAVSAEAYSLGQTSTGYTTGTPNTFIFGFSGVGGDPVVTNEPPVANAGPDQTIPCAAATSPTAVTLAGSATDEDGDPLTFAWFEGSVQIATGASPTVLLGPGVHTLALVANDGTVDSDPDLVVITIAADTVAPVFTSVPAPAVAEYAAPGTPVALGAATASDACGPVTITSDAPALFPYGTTVVTFTATDARGNTATATTTVLVRDTTPPVLTTPAAVSAEATSAAGASVSYATGATDLRDGTVPVFCTPPSGSLLPLGDTTVSCWATDSAGNLSAASFTATVSDTTGPAWSSFPDDINQDAWCTQGAWFGWADPVAEDAVDGLVAVTCDHQPWEEFPLGTTVVTCTATDSRGNTSTRSFSINFLWGWGGFQPPIANDGSSAFRVGDAVAVKFLLTGYSAWVTDVNARLFIAPVSGGTVGAESPAAPAAGSTGNQFAYSFGYGTWDYNMATSHLAAGTYQLRADLGDGTTRTVRITLNP